MKNKPNPDILFLKSVKKIFLIMKISFLLIMLSVLNAYATSIFSQSAKVSVNMQNATVREVVGEIEKQGGINFLFNDNLPGLNKRVSISFVDQPIKNVLEDALSQANMTYEEIKDDFVVLLSNFDYNVQQEITITGKVVDAETGEPLPGVSVVLRGTNIGTVTNVNGEYSLSNIPPEGELVFSFVGMQTQIVSINNRENVDVALSVETIGIDEVVAVGYATRAAGDVTGSITSVRSEEIRRTASINAGEALRGSVSGLTVTTSNTPGAGATVRIRGLGTINDNSPLWVIDGVPGGSVSPEEIESITVLKDAASQAIYGARAANGVIIVTTVSGRRATPAQIDVSARNGFKQLVNQWDLLNTQEYGEMLWLMAANDGRTNYSHPQYGSGPSPIIPNYIYPAGAESADYSLYDNRMIHENGTDTYIIMRANQEGTRWLNEATQIAPYQEYNLRVSGGGDDSNYALSAGYLKEEGILLQTGYDRYNLRSNVTSNIANWLEVGKRIGLSYSERYGHLDDQGESGMSFAYRMQPIIPVYDVMNNFAGTLASGTGNARNLVFLTHRDRNDIDKALVTTGTFYADANILEGLSFRTLLGFDYYTRDRYRYSIVERAFAERGMYNSSQRRSDFRYQWNWTNTLQYSNTFNELHNVTLMLGTEAIDYSSEYHGAQRNEFAFEDPNYMKLDVGERDQSNYGNSSEWALFSVFGRVNYSYDRKYFLEAVVRQDASSRFGPDSRRGIFPAFSLGWRLSNEEFMAAVSNSWLDHLMLRLGYGQTGNDRVGNYNSFTTYATSITHSFYPIEGQNTGVGNAGFYPQASGNHLVQWESTTTYNAGLQMNFLSNFDFSFDLWRRNTKDMLFPQRIPDVRGQISAPSINVGEMMNNGFDLELGYRGSNLAGDLNFGISLNVSRYKNEIVQLTNVEGERLEGSSFRHQMYTMAESGTAFPLFYGYIIDGIFQNEAEVASHSPAFGDYNAVGKFKFRDVNGDGVVDANDRTIIGDPHPDFTAGLNLDISYKGFTLSTRLYGSYGNDMVNFVNRWIDFPYFTGNMSSKALYESFGSPYLADNRDAKLPLASFNYGIEHLPSTYYVEDASYLRMQNLRLGYNLTRLSRINLRDLTIYGHISNVFTITNYTGLDPEINISGVNMGIDRGGWPTPRQFMIGVNIGI